MGPEVILDGMGVWGERRKWMEYMELVMSSHQDPMMGVAEASGMSLLRS